MRSRAVIFALLALVAPVWAALPKPAPLKILADTGRTLPVGDLLASFAPAMLDESPPASAASSAFVPWPVRTPAMRAGQAAPRAALRLPGTLSMPLALMGTDPYSLAWLQRRHAWLAQQGAAIQVVESADEAAFRQVQALAGTLPLVPASAQGLAKSYQLTHYPIVILRNGGLAQ